MKRSVFFLVMAVSMLFAAPLTHATIINYTANLSPTNGSNGTGSALVTIDDILNTMIVDVTFSGLSGTTALRIFTAAQQFL